MGASPRDYNLTAARLGGYAGFNWQNGLWVFGPEVDFGWSNIEQDKTYLPGLFLRLRRFPVRSRRPQRHHTRSD